MSQLEQLRKGSTKLLILDGIGKEAKYGYQIMRELEERSEGYFSLTAASLYPALHQLEEDGLVESEWRAGQGNRRRKYYTLTKIGHKALVDHLAEWQRFFNKLFDTLNLGTAGVS
jgi:DNA-binding PadR family transcriptional regulator